jgi:hypothetical protein
MEQGLSEEAQVGIQEIVEARIREFVDATFETISGSANNDPIPDTVFHYTTAEGLLGIVRNRELWATHISYLNDKIEFIYAFRLLAAEAGKRFDSRQESLDTAGQFLALLTRDAPHRVFDDVYVACFCHEKDSLNHWRAYGRGSGFAIEINPTTGDKSSSLKPGNTGKASLGQVLYDRRRQTQLISRVIDHCVTFIESWGDTSKEAANSSAISLASFIHVVVAILASKLKHPAFSSECEWRMVCSPHERIAPTRPDFRSSAGLVVPYLPLKAAEGEKLPIKAVWCGPTSEVNLSIRSAEMLLNRYGYDVPIKSSELFLR